MAVARWCRMALVGDYSTGPFAGEIWETGISFVASDVPENFGAAIKESWPTLTVDIIGFSQDATTYNIDWSWHGSQTLEEADQIALADAAVAFWNGVKALAPAASRLTAVKIQALDAFGKTLNGSNWFALKTPVAGTGNNASYLPPQVGVVASLRTGARGPGGRGRMYLPLNGITTTTGLLSTSNRTSVLTAVGNLIPAINSNKVAAAVVNRSKGTYSTITEVAVGDGLDIQRRRANAFNETYAQQPVAWP